MVSGGIKKGGNIQKTPCVAQEDYDSHEDVTIHQRKGLVWESCQKKDRKSHRVRREEGRSASRDGYSSVS